MGLLKIIRLDNVISAPLAANKSGSLGALACALTASGYHQIASSDKNGERVRGVMLEDVAAPSTDGGASVKVGQGLFEIDATSMARTDVGAPAFVKNGGLALSGNITGTGAAAGWIQEYVSATRVRFETPLVSGSAAI